MKHNFFLVFFMLAVPSLVLAHGGHGHFEDAGILHYLSSPWHLLSIGFVLVVGILLYKKRKISIER